MRRSTGKMESCFTTRIPPIALTVSTKNRKKETMNIENAIFGSCIILNFLSKIRATVEPKIIVASKISPAVIPVESRVIESATGTSIPILGRPITCLIKAIIVASIGNRRIRIIVLEGTPDFTEA